MLGGVRCLLRLILCPTRVGEDRATAPNDGAPPHTLDCPPDCSCWQELRAADDGLRRAIEDFRFSIEFADKIEQTEKEIATASERRIGVFKIFVGPALVDADMPPALIRLDEEAYMAASQGSIAAWIEVLKICEQHSMALKNQIAGE